MCGVVVETAEAAVGASVDRSPRQVARVRLVRM